MGVNKDRDFGKSSQKKARSSGDYWRIAREIEAGECVFCNLKDKYIIRKSELSVLTANIFPYINGQLLVIPFRHIVDINEATSDEAVDMQQQCIEGINLLKEKLEIDSVWVILRNGNLAGKTIKHLHWNILPYVEGLNTWHYQKITLSPIDLASKLRGENGRS